MKKSISILFFLVFGITSSFAQLPSLEDLNINIDNPLIKFALKQAAERYLPEVTDENIPIKEIQFLKIKKKENKGIIKIKGSILPKGGNVVTGYGDYRFRAVVSDDFTKPEVKRISFHIPRLKILFFRFYVRAYPRGKNK